jgi:hypothetical protein
MVILSDNKIPGSEARRSSVWLRIFLAVLASLSALYSVPTVAAGMAKVFSVFVGEGFDGWCVLGIAEAIAGLTGMAGAWFNFGRRANAWTLIFIVVQLPIPVLIEANQCDVESICRSTDWMRLPSSFFAWRFPATLHKV